MRLAPSEQAATIEATRSTSVHNEHRSKWSLDLLCLARKIGDKIAANPAFDNQQKKLAKARLEEWGRRHGRFIWTLDALARLWRFKE